jgi:hypothetical protein
MWTRPPCTIGALLELMSRSHRRVTNLTDGMASVIYRHTFPRIPRSHRISYCIKTTKTLRLSAFDCQLRRLAARFHVEEHGRHQECLGSGSQISLVSPNSANTTHASQPVRNEAAWPMIDYFCQERAHALICMRASRRGRMITTISVVAEQSWFS